MIRCVSDPVEIYRLSEEYDLPSVFFSEKNFHFVATGSGDLLFIHFSPGLVLYITDPSESQPHAMRELLHTMQNKFSETGEELYEIISAFLEEKYIRINPGSFLFDPQ